MDAKRTISPDDPRVTPPSFEDAVGKPSPRKTEAVATDVVAPGHSMDEPITALPREVTDTGVPPIPKDDPESWVEPEKNEYPGP